jgi:ABC-2 type transport system permease protein
MMRLLRLIRAYWVNSLALDLEYRADFLISAVTSLLSCGAGLLALSVIFSHAESLGGWTFPQALALYGVYLFLEEYAQGFLTNNIGQVPELIRRGDLDFTLSSRPTASFRSPSAISGLPTCPPIFWRLASFFMR